MSDGQVQGHQLTDKGTVFFLWDSQMGTEESRRLPTNIGQLFKYCAHCYTKCIHCEGWRSIGPWVAEHCWISQCLLSVVKCGHYLFVSNELFRFASHLKNGWSILASAGIKRWQKLIIPTNSCSPLMVTDLANFIIASTLWGSRTARCWLLRCQRKSMEFGQIDI